MLFHDIVRQVLSQSSSYIREHAKQFWGETPDAFEAACEQPEFVDIIASEVIKNPVFATYSEFLKARVLWSIFLGYAYDF